MPSQLPNLQKHARGPKKQHDTDMNLNYTIPVIVNGQVFSSKSEKMSARNEKLITVVVNYQSVGSVVSLHA